MSQIPATSEAICEIERCEMLKITNTIAGYLGNHVKIEISPSEALSWIREQEVKENAPLLMVLVLNYPDAQLHELWNQLAINIHSSQAKFAQVAISFEQGKGINLLMRKNFN